jgi:hypothetical protein
MLARTRLPFPVEIPGGAGSSAVRANWASIVNANPPNSTPSSGIFNVAAIMLKVQSSGIFRVGVNALTFYAEEIAA